MLAALEARLRTYWNDLTGEARAELETLIADAKEREAKIMPLIGAFKADMAQALASAEPELKTAAEGLLAKLEADAATLVGEAAKGM